MGMLPDELNNCQMYGVEIDSISGRIAGQLYQKNTIAIQGYEKTNIPDNFFDIAVGNVPFAEHTINDRKYNKYNFFLHDYFFAKTLDKVRPGGIIAFITSKGTMDKENNKVRKYLSQRAELVGAIRLPDNTFKDNAGTKVTTDIIFLKKRDKITDIEEDWINLDVDENGIKINKYFVDNPEMILGKMVKRTGNFGKDVAICEMIEGSNLESMLSKAILNIQTEIEEYDIDEDIEEENSISADPKVKNFSYAVIDNKVYYRENSRMYEKHLPETTINRIKGMVKIRDCTRNLINLQLEDFSDDEIKKEQQKLNVLYDDFVNKYGRINSRPNNQAFSEDNSYYLLCSLEVIDTKGNFLKKAEMFSKKTINAKKEITRVDTSNEALILSLTEKAKVDIEYMKSLTDKTEEELVKDLEGQIFLVPDFKQNNKKYVTADEYLSGNVREKLDMARMFAINHPEFEVNVRELEKAIPEEIKASEITVKLGATWIPEKYIEKFIYELLETPIYYEREIRVHYSDITSQWNITGKSVDKYNVKASKTYGIDGKTNAYRIIETALNLNDIKVYKTITDFETGEEKRVLDKQKTAMAQAKEDEIKMKFEEWIFKDSNRREELVKLYNERFNSIRNREYDGSYLKFYGMNPEIKLTKAQVNAVARGLYSGNTLLAHEVGAGKTFEMVAIAMESKRLGLCNKPILTMPNHIVEQFASDFLRLYPSSNILVTTKKDFLKNNRKKFCSKIATGDFDAILIGHSQFEKIPMSLERQRYFLNKQIKEIVDGIVELKRQSGEKFSIRQLEITKKALEAKLEKLNNQDKKDDVITFEELGVDKLFVDEAHYYKNLFLQSKMKKIAGIGNSDAQKSSDMFMKCQYMDEITRWKRYCFCNRNTNFK